VQCNEPWQVLFEVEVEVEVEVTLQLTVSQSVSQSVSMSWCRAPRWGLCADIPFSFLLSENCFALRLEAPSLTRSRLKLIYD
jgi:hypothetical protein